MAVSAASVRRVSRLSVRRVSRQAQQGQRPARTAESGTLRVCRALAANARKDSRLRHRLLRQSRSQSMSELPKEVHDSSGLTSILW